jgi:hypothetical protein
VLLHNAKAFHLKPPLRSEYIVDAHYQDAYERFNRLSSECEGADDDFLHKFPVALFYSCRQIYHEATGILYGKNTFNFSRVDHCHDSNGHYPRLLDDKEYHPLNYAPIWLSAIGSQVSLLQEISIDLNALCSFSNTQPHISHLDLLPLARFFWTHMDINCRLSVSDVCQVSAHHSGVDATWPQSAVTYKERCLHLKNILNNILNAVVLEDVLDLKRFAYSNRLLAQIGIEPTSHEAHILYASPTVTKETIFQTFNIEDSGTAFKPGLVFKHTLQALSRKVRCKILELACLSQGTVELDLDQGKLYGVDLAYFHSSMALRYQFKDLHLPKDYPFTIKMTSRELVTHVHPSKLLDREMASSEADVNIIGRMMKDAFYYHPNVTLWMNFCLETSSTLDEVRINIRELSRPIDGSGLLSGTKLRFTLSRPDESGSYEGDATPCVADLRMRLFLLLSDMIISWPDNVARGGKSSLPDIWINGRGIIIKAVYPATKDYPAYSVKNRHGELQNEDVHHEGYRLIETLQSEPYLSIKRELWDGGSNIIYLWSNLQHLYWKDIFHDRGVMKGCSLDSRRLRA